MKVDETHEVCTFYLSRLISLTTSTYQNDESNLEAEKFSFSS